MKIRVCSLMKDRISFFVGIFGSISVAVTSLSFFFYRYNVGISDFSMISNPINQSYDDGKAINSFGVVKI